MRQLQRVLTPAVLVGTVGSGRVGQVVVRPVRAAAAGAGRELLVLQLAQGPAQALQVAPLAAAGRQHAQGRHHRRHGASLLCLPQP